MTSNEIRQIVGELEARDLLDACRRHALHRHVTVHEVIDDMRFRPAELARHALWYELFAEGCWTYRRIGSLFRRDRQTIRQGIRAHEARLDAERERTGTRPVCPYSLELDDAGGLGHG
jgi:hypothetical protein